MRLILIGTGAFAVPTFQALLASPHDVAAIVTRPIAPRGDRQRAPANPVREAFADTGIPLVAPHDINADEACQQLAAWNPDLLVVCDYGQILADHTLRLVRLGGINLHGSLLPKYRGAAPVNWAIWNGERETGVTVIHMTARLDGGPCLAVARTEIGAEEDAPALERRLAALGVTSVLETIDTLSAWDGVSPIGTPQNAQQASHARRLRKSDGDVDWSQPATRIANQVRALRPWPGTYTHWLRQRDPIRLLLERVTVADAPSAHVHAPPGTVVAVAARTIAVATGEGCLVLDQLKPAGKRVMETSEFLRGYPVQPGDRFGRLAP